MEKVKIGIIGFGTVGRGAFEIMRDNGDIIRSRLGKELVVTKIYDRSFNKKKDLYNLSDSLNANSAEEVYTSDEVDIVIEAIGGIEPATTYMIEAMKNKKSVVTPNKAAVAENFLKLRETALDNKVSFRFEASVGGGIPCITSILEPLSSNKFTQIMGILNGTTNYILTKMYEEGADYKNVLKDAQEKGFAEANPTADVEGIDVANKLAILSAIAFNKIVKPSNIEREGISKITLEDIEKAKADGKVIKLIAYGKLENDQLTAYVRPTLLPTSHPLATVNNEFNAIYISGNAVDDVMLYGKGAGSLPTGSAIVGDVIAIAKVL